MPSAPTSRRYRPGPRSTRRYVHGSTRPHAKSDHARMRNATVARIANDVYEGVAPRRIPRSKIPSMKEVGAGRSLTTGAGGGGGGDNGAGARRGCVTAGVGVGVGSASSAGSASRMSAAWSVRGELRGRGDVTAQRGARGERDVERRDALLVEREAHGRTDAVPRSVGARERLAHLADRVGPTRDLERRCDRERRRGAAGLRRGRRGDRERAEPERRGQRRRSRCRGGRAARAHGRECSHLAFGRSRSRPSRGGAK